MPLHPLKSAEFSPRVHEIHRALPHGDRKKVLELNENERLALLRLMFGPDDEAALQYSIQSFIRLVHWNLQRTLSLPEFLIVGKASGKKWESKALVNPWMIAKPAYLERSSTAIPAEIQEDQILDLILQDTMEKATRQLMPSLSGLSDSNVDTSILWHSNIRLQEEEQMAAFLHENKGIGIVQGYVRNGKSTFTVSLLQRQFAGKGIRLDGREIHKTSDLFDSLSLKDFLHLFHEEAFDLEGALEYGEKTLDEALFIPLEQKGEEVLIIIDEAAALSDIILQELVEIEQKYSCIKMIFVWQATAEGDEEFDDKKAIVCRREHVSVDCAALSQDQTREIIETWINAPMHVSEEVIDLLFDWSGGRIGELLMIFSEVMPNKLAKLSIGVDDLKVVPKSISQVYENIVFSHFSQKELQIMTRISKNNFAAISTDWHIEKLLKYGFLNKIHGGYEIRGRWLRNTFASQK